MDHNSSPLAGALDDENVESMQGDPYLWLEDGDDPEVIAWTHAQDAAAQRVLQSTPGRASIERQLEEFLQVPEVIDGRVAGGQLFTLRREPGHEHPILYVRDGLDGEDRVMLDPGQEDASGLTSMDWWYPSPDGRLLAYGVSRAGDEWSDLRIRDTSTGDDLSERIPRVRSASVAWLPDSSGFFYTRYPMTGEVPPDEENYWRRVYLHTLGSNYGEDPLVWGNDRPMEELPNVTLDPTGRWLVVDADLGWSRTQVFVLDQEKPDHEPRDITPPEEASHKIVGVIDGVLYSHTFAGAPKGQLLGRLLVDPDAGWQVVIPEQDDFVLTQVIARKSGFVTSESRDASHVLRRYLADGTLVDTYEPPELGQVSWIAGSPESEVALVGFTSFLQPTCALALVDGEPVRELVRAGLEGFNRDDYEIHREWCISRDGTRVPLFLFHRKDLELDGANPTVLGGYGGFRLPLGPVFTPEALPWIASGGVYAIACLRGGGEYGLSWHRAGMRENKQNVFDDFIAASEHVIDRGYTSSERLGIRGRSNGGLLVGAAMTQRPDLFRAVYCGVPLLDMLRYHLFQIARIWIPEYGSAEDPEQRQYLQAYSPYHQVRDGVAYPATLITCAENDTRVDPMHARKMTARLQEATSTGNDRPILLRAERDAGHGAGMPMHMRVRNAADMWSFFGWQLGIEWAG